MRGLPSERFDPGYDLPAPSDQQLRRLAHELGFELSEATFAAIAERVRGSVAALHQLRAIEPATPPTRYPRLAGRVPTTDENPYNGWSWRCDVQGADSGALAGMTIAVKESICVAGVPMSNGSALMEGHVPQYDATVVSRLLDAGATIAGKATSENLGLSSGSNTSVTGPVLNPANLAHSAGGSSSGCAALVAARACDGAIGTDNGGSVRIPAALCGVVGLKPTFGLVPYTGVLSIETSIDHVGLFGRDSATVVALLDATGGPDGFDSRYSPRAPDAMSERLDRDGPPRLGLVQEGMDLLASSNAGDLVYETVDRLRSDGVIVEMVAIPEHALSSLAATPIYAEGICSQLFESGGTSLGWKGFYPEAELVAMLRALRAQPSLLPDTGKLFAILGAHLRQTHLGRQYLRAQNIALSLRDVYDQTLERFDALILPTCAPEPLALPLPEEPGPNDVFDAAFGYHANAAIFNLTGHPAVSVPAGESDGLPLGVMLVGRHGDDSKLLRLASAIEMTKSDRS